MNIIDTKLQELKKRLRNHVAIDGYCSIFFGIVFCLCVHFALDRFFEFGILVRFLMLVSFFIAIFFLWKRYILWLIPYKITDEQIAIIFEKHEPKLNESLVTSVQLRNSTELNHPILLHVTNRQAADLLANVSISQIFATKRLSFRCVAAVMLFLSVGTLCLFHAETAKIWMRRAALLSEEWPRRTELVVQGFDENGSTKIARGDSFSFAVLAKASVKRVPDSIRIDFGNRTLVLNEFQIDSGNRVFRCEIPNVLESQNIVIFGGDVRLERFLYVVQSPVLSYFSAVLKYPAYLFRPEKAEQNVGTRIAVPAGTSMFFSAASSKPLKSALLLPNTNILDSASEIRFSLPDISKDISVEIQLLDADGIANRTPIRLDIHVTQDTPPLISAKIDGVGSAITNLAKLPFEGLISDDYGLNVIEFKSLIDRKSSNGPAEYELQIASLAGRFAEFPLKTQFSVAELLLEPDDRLTLFLEASDAFPHTCNSERFHFDIVSPAKLRGILEAKEVGLRLRFEAIIDEVRRTEKLFADFHDDDVLSRVLRDTQKEAFDLKQIETAFLAIRKELYNNQILRSEDSKRLDMQIIEPIHAIHEFDFPHLDFVLSSATQKESVPFLFEAIIAKMLAIRDNMIAMESYNEILDLLRGIIKEQESVRGETQNERKEQMKKILSE